MDEQIRLIRDSRHGTKMMHIKRSMWENPQTLQQKKAVRGLKDKGWREPFKNESYTVTGVTADLEFTPNVESEQTPTEEKKKRKNAKAEETI